MDETERSRHSILVVDADDLARDLAVMTLRLAGYSVAASEDGLHALAVIETGRFDLVLIDLVMPVMTGVVVIERIRVGETDGLERTAVIVLTGLEFDDQAAFCLGHGLDGVISKRDGPLALRDAVDAFFLGRPSRL